MYLNSIPNQLILLTAILGLTGPLRAHDESAELDAFFEMWKARQQIAETVRYKLSGERFAASGTVVPNDGTTAGIDMPAGGYPVEDTSYPVSCEWLLCFRDSRFRKESRDMSFNMRSKAYRPFVRTEVFDGESWKGYWPRKENTSRHYTPHVDKEEAIFWKDGDLKLMVFHGDSPVMLAHGFLDLTPGNRPKGLESIPWEVVGEAQIDEHRCLVLEHSTDNELCTRIYVSDALEGAVLRLEMQRENFLQRSLEIEYALTNEYWLPNHWEMLSYRKSGAIYRKLNHHVDTIELGPETVPESFKIPLRPGMIVLRCDQDFKKVQVAANGQFEPYVPSYVTTQRKSSRPWVIVNIVALVAIILAIAIRKLKAQT